MKHDRVLVINLVVTSTSGMVRYRDLVSIRSYVPTRRYSTQCTRRGASVPYGLISSLIYKGEYYFLAPSNLIVGVLCFPAGCSCVCSSIHVCPPIHTNHISFVWFRFCNNGSKWQNEFVRLAIPTHVSVNTGSISGVRLRQWQKKSRKFIPYVNIEHLPLCG